MSDHPRTFVPASHGFYRLVAYLDEGQMFFEKQPVVAWAIETRTTRNGDVNTWAEAVSLDTVASNGEFEAVLSPDGRVVMFAETEFESEREWREMVVENFNERLRYEAQKAVAPPKDTTP